MQVRQWVAVAALAALAGLAVQAAAHPARPPLAVRDTGTMVDAPAGLDRLAVVAVRPHVGGYDRSCSPGRGCVFGPPWSDDVSVEGGHNGCSTRDDVLRRDLTAVATRPGTRGCVVIAGTLSDPYSGEQVTFTKEAAWQVPVDHVFALAAAWDLGAASWPPERRQDFANDPRNLLATTVAVNLAKGDRMPGEWSPATDAGRCLYARRFVAVAAAYALPVTRADVAGLRADLGRCP